MSRADQAGGGIFRSQLRRSVRPTGSRFETACNRELTKCVGLERVLAYENASDASEEDFGFSGCSSCIKYTDDGDLVAVAGPDCRVVLFDALDGSCRYAVEGHSEIVTGLAWVDKNRFASEESLFYTSSLDKSIRLWKGEAHVATYKDHHDWIRSLAISGDSKTLVSGCVSSNIFLWDTETGKTTYRTQSMFGLDDKLNKVPGSMRSFCTSFEYSVNSVNFFQTNTNLFVSGMRDGTVRVWDCRDIGGGAVATLFAHNLKLNHVQMGQGDAALLTSGRDSVIRLWDTRMLGSTPSRNKKCLLMEFDSHKCRSYNISCTFFGNDRAIATGSEDNKVWIYDAKDGSVIQTLSGHASVVHNITTPRNQSYNLQLATSSIDSNEVNVWSARYKEARVAGAAAQGMVLDEDEEMCFTRMNSLESRAEGPGPGRPMDQGEILEHYPEGVATSLAVDPTLAMEYEAPGEVAMAEADGEGSQNILEAHRLGIESLMRKHGDVILKIFHACDYSFRSSMDWRSMIQRLSSTMNGAGGEGDHPMQTGDQDSHISGVDQEIVMEAVMEMAALFSQMADEQRVSTPQRGPED